MKDELGKLLAMSAKPAANTWIPVAEHARNLLPLPTVLERVEGLHPWLAAQILADEFETVFLWSSDCGGQRFAALGCYAEVGLQELGDVAAEMAAAINLPRSIADELPLGLFVGGQTDERPAAFMHGEGETGTRAWVPQLLLLQQREATVPISIDSRVNKNALRRLRKAVDGTDISLAELRMQGSATHVLEHPVESEADWQARIALGLAAIEGGTLEKVVLSRRMRIQPARGALSTWASAGQVLKGRGRNRFAISTNGGESMFIGATPETLLRIDGGRLTTHALAGTLHQGASLEQFLSSKKLREEHNYVSDGVAATLAPFTRHMSAGPLCVRQSGTVSHLETPLEGELEGDAGAIDILQALHPTPAIGGWPRRAALDALEVIEPYSRGWFAAPLGWLAGGGNAHAAIAIRSQWVSSQRSVMLAGAGIVRESDAALEWQETEIKFDNMRCVLRGRSGVG